MYFDQTVRIVLFGHRDFDGHDTLEERLYPLLKAIIRKTPFTEVYIGRNGEFDVFAASIVKRLQNDLSHEKSELICVLPYRQKDIEFYDEYYDSVIIPECVAKSHPKGAITKRNRWMVEWCNLFACYVEREKGGAYKAMKYAQRLGKPVINLAKESYEEDFF